MYYCPHCNVKTNVLDSRPLPRGTRRWKQCPKCKRKFVTYEIEENELSVKTINKLRQPYPRESK